MFSDDKLYQAYLQEMESLESFRTTHSTLYRETPLEFLEDPDTLRLVEALAFFSARSRVLGLKKISQLHQILFSQYFSFLINPMPIMGLLQVNPTLKIPEKVTLEEGTEFSAHTYDQRKATFQTLHQLDVFPIFFSGFNFFHRIKGEWQLELSFKASYPQSECLEEIPLYINHMSSFLGGIRAYFALCRSLESIQVYYDKDKITKREGKPCTWKWGMPEHRKAFNHPLEKIRSYLHFPEQQMSMTIKLPPRKKKWEELTLVFELNQNWPDQISLTKNSIVPFVVPIANLKTSNAEPISCNGTKDSYPILYPNPAENCTLHSILGVYEVTPDGMKPLKPGVLDKKGRTYEVDFLEEKIYLDLPDSFEKPSKVSIEAFWTQLWFSDYIDQEFKLHIAEEQVTGLQPRLLQQLHNHEIPLVASDPQFLIRILSLKNQNHLKLNEVLFLMQGLKNLDHSYFRMIPPLIKELKVKQQLDRSGMGPVVCYEFRLKEWDGRNWEQIVYFFHIMNQFLNCWLSNFHIETIVLFPQLKTPLHFKGEHDDELSLVARNFFLPESY